MKSQRVLHFSVAVVLVSVGLALAACTLGQSAQDPSSVAEALQTIRSVDDPDWTLPAEDYLLRASRESTAVVSRIVDSAQGVGMPYKSEHALVLALIWEDQGASSGVAYAALLSLLDDPDVSFEVAVWLAQGGDASGAMVLSQAAHAGVTGPATSEELRRAEKARYWLTELGLE